MERWMGGLIALTLMPALAWLWPGRGLIRDIRGLEAECRALEVRRAAALQARAEVEKIEAELRRLEARLAELRRRLPEAAELRTVFEGVVFRARGAGLEIEAWRPGPAQDPGASGGPPYRAWPIEVEAQGVYHALGRLAEALLGLERVVVLAGWRLETAEAGPPPRLRLRLRVETYTYRPPPPKPPAPSPPPPKPPEALDERP